MNDIMVDIETLATSYNAVITQIGACYFDRETGEIGEQFCVNISVKDCLDIGMVIDDGSLKFWFEQKEHSWLKGYISLTGALQKFRNFCRQNKKAKIWSHVTFDMPIIANAYWTIKQGLPFSFRACRDIRTLVDLSTYDRKVEKG